MEQKYSNRLKELRKAAGLSQAKVAELVGISGNAYQRYEYGERDIPGKILLRLAEVFSTTSDHILQVSGTKDSNIAKWVKVPLFGRIAAGQPLEMDNCDDWGYVPAPVRDKHPDGFLLAVEGESMNNVLPNGCLAYVERCTDVDDDRQPYAVCVNGYDATIKRVRKLENGFVLEPDSSDPTFRPKTYDFGEEGTETVSVIGRVVYYVLPFDWEF